MTKGRLEAFSDGVIAIIITIMVLELRAPHGADLAALRPLVPTFLSYLLSFVYVAIYWNNHHHMFQVVEHVDGRVLWANMHLLFWLSMVPFVTAWMGANHFAPWPVALYGVVLLLNGVAYFILVRALVTCEGHNVRLAAALGRDVKGRLSVLIYALAAPLAFVQTWLAGVGYVAVALMWLVPDRRIEKHPGRARS